MSQWVAIFQSKALQTRLLKTDLDGKPEAMEAGVNLLLLPSEGLCLVEVVAIGEVTQMVEEEEEEEEELVEMTEMIGFLLQGHLEEQEDAVGETVAGEVAGVVLVRVPGVLHDDVAQRMTDFRSDDLYYYCFLVLHEDPSTSICLHVHKSVIDYIV